MWQQDCSDQKQCTNGANGTAERTRNREVYVPQVDILESENPITLLVDMPGVADDGVDVTIEKNLLTVKGTVPEETVEGHSLSYSEYGVGDYERSFTISNEVDREGVEAVLKNGVLKLVLPKAKHALTHKVTVRSAE